MENGRCRLHLTVSPGASRNEVWRAAEGDLRARIAAPPREGKANTALIAFLADRLRISRSRVSLVRGEASRHKLIEIHGLELDEVLSRLGLG